jgi:hypothetical protein
MIIPSHIVYRKKIEMGGGKVRASNTLLIANLETRSTKKPFEMSTFENNTAPAIPEHQQWANMADEDSAAQNPVVPAAREQEKPPSATSDKGAEPLKIAYPIYLVGPNGAYMVKGFGKCQHDQPCKFGAKCRDNRAIPSDAKFEFAEGFGCEEGDLFSINAKLDSELCIFCKGGKCRNAGNHGKFPRECRVVGKMFTSEVVPDAPAPNPTPVNTPAARPPRAQAPKPQAIRAANSAPPSAERPPPEPKTGDVIDGEEGKKEKSDKSTKPPKAGKGGDYVRENRKPADQQKRRKDGNTDNAGRRFSKIGDMAQAMKEFLSLPYSIERDALLKERVEEIIRAAAKPSKGSAGSPPSSPPSEEKVGSE